MKDDTKSPKDKKREHILEPCDQTVQCSVCLHAEWMDDHLPEECPGPPGSQARQVVSCPEPGIMAIRETTAQDCNCPKLHGDTCPALSSNEGEVK
jgi:hypothetical protein